MNYEVLAGLGLETSAEPVIKKHTHYKIIMNYEVLGGLGLESSAEPVIKKHTHVYKIIMNY